MKKSSGVLYVIGLLFAVAQAVVSVLLVVSVFRMNVLPDWANIIFAFVMAVIFIICALPLVFYRKRWTAFRIICIILSFLTIGGGVFALRYTDSINAFLDKISMTSESGVDVEYSELDITKDPFILYISGTDSRHGVKATARSDVNIVVVVNPKQGKILLVSIPRDTYVQLHGTTGIKDKLTHAGVYGINMSKTTIEDFLGIKIDYTAKVSFDTVVKVVDQIDGIEIDSDKEMKLKTENKEKICEYKVGKQWVDGDCALRFARERKSYEAGDRHRGENQMQVITAIIARLSGSKNYVLNLPNILDIAADSFETSFTRDDIGSFIRMQLGQGINWKVESISVDGTGSMQGTYSMGANRPLYVMLANPGSVEAAKTKINEYLVK